MKGGTKVSTPYLTTSTMIMPVLRGRKPLGRLKGRMREILKQFAPKLRARGFRGSGQNFRKVDGDFVFVVNFQGSLGGDVFYVNLGAQPSFIPTENNTDLNPKSLKEYDCVFRTRVGKAWHWEMSASEQTHLMAEFDVVQSEFFGRARTLQAAISSDPPETLLKKFSFGATGARTALHLARGSLALGNYEKASALAERGLELAAKGAQMLKDQLDAVIDKAQGPAAQ